MSSMSGQRLIRNKDVGVGGFCYTLKCLTSVTQFSHYRTRQDWLSVCFSSATLHSTEEHPAEQVLVRVLLIRPQALSSQESITR